ncbi:MAG: response regulator transcription factor [Anaerolineales bacterium]|nr:response regulator transcription factor [Anaerolineales bacterium]
MTIKVLIADDHKLFRQGLIGLMETREDLVEVVGEAATGKEAVQLVEQTKPDVVLMDIYMPDGDGLHALRQIREGFPKVHVVMLTSSENDKHIYQAVQFGAAGYLLKNLDASQLFELIEGVIHGEAAMTRDMASRLLKSVAKRTTNPDRGEETLTERELAVLRLVAVGATNQEISERLTISINTVKSHIRNILDKLQLENRTQAANYAIHRGLVFPMDR